MSGGVFGRAGTAREEGLLLFAMKQKAKTESQEQKCQQDGKNNEKCKSPNGKIRNPSNVILNDRSGKRGWDVVPNIGLIIIKVVVSSCRSNNRS